MTIARTSSGPVVQVLVLALCLGSCGGKKDKKPTEPDEIGTGEAGGLGEGGASGGGGGLVDTEPAVPTEGDPEDHFLGHGDLFAGYAAYSQGTAYVEPVIEIAPPGDTGKGTFKQVRTGTHMETEHFWKTHKATKDELKVGVIALMDETKDDQGIYSAPGTVEQAYDGRWWMARIVSVKPLESKGYVWVAGGYKVAPDAIRLLEGDDSPTVTLEGEEDAHFVRSDHQIAGYQALPEQGNIYVSICAAVGPMDGGEGRFINLNKGVIFDTAHAWKTKIADKKDIKVGGHVIVPEFKDGGIYAPPKTRKDALFNRWWIVKVEKKQKKTVIVDGDYEVAIDALRVIE